KQENQVLSRRAHQQQRQKKQQKKKSRKGLIWKSILALVLLSLTGVLSYGALMIADTQNLLNKAFVERDRKTTVNGKEVELKDVDPLKDPIAILVMGIDDN